MASCSGTGENCVEAKTKFLPVSLPVADAAGPPLVPGVEHAPMSTESAAPIANRRTLERLIAHDLPCDCQRRDSRRPGTKKRLAACRPRAPAPRKPRALRRCASAAAEARRA